MEKETIIQFGEGNFLRGFFDDFIQQLHDKGLYSGKVVAIKPLKHGSLAPFFEQEFKYNLFLYGVENGRAVSRRSKIDVISRCISPYDDWHGVISLADNESFRFIVSNTTESGIVFDENCKMSDCPPAAFPAKLTLLLHRRYKAKLPGFILLPCELIDNNGQALKTCVLKYARLWGLGPDFESWVKRENIFANTLVDRIVSGYPKTDAKKYRSLLGYDDALLDTGELYHRWVIEGCFENELPLQKAGINVIWADNVSPYKKQKVRILNGAHTCIVAAALAAGLETVDECMADSDISAFLHKCLFSEIIPAMPQDESNRDFALEVLQRFENPYIKHRLSAIALNCADKYRVRVLPSVNDYINKFAAAPPCLLFAFAAMIYCYKSGKIQDDEKIANTIKSEKLAEIFNNTKLWGADLNAIYGEVNNYYEMIKRYGIRKAIKWIL
ncbi:MAG: tagaturonate reductase [Clostridiales bacterium]|nr:tagaturonate reductase [Clostridiales bacterium]